MLRRMAPVLLLLGACVPPEEAIPGLAPPEWQDGETSVYHITKNDSLLYRARTVLRFDEEFGVPTAEVTHTVEPVTFGRFFFDSSTVVFHRDSLKPRRSARSLETDIAIFDIESRYEAGVVFIRKQSIDGIEERTLKLGPRSYDSEMIRTLLRSVPLESGTSFRLSSVVPMDLRTVPVDVMVLGTGRVTCGVGNVLCREVVLITPAKEVRMWYEIEQPHRLISLRDPEGETEMTLMGYSASRPDTLDAGIPELPEP